MINILIVDDNKLICETLERMLKAELDCKLFIAYNKKEMIGILRDINKEIDNAIIDFHLSDAPSGQAIGPLVRKEIPSIVLTNEDITHKKEFSIFNEHIIDYIIKDGGYSFEYLINLIKRFLKNKEIQVLLVDDSQVAILALTDKLKKFNINPLIAKDGVQALEILKKHREIRLLITDYNMPNMDGVELVKQVREKHPKNKLAIKYLFKIDVINPSIAI